ncbi:MAG TPA: thermostable hemolysin, partial [Herbaspirillum sp.]|nr:thermostable hemolysin [Herbaspirillum sp.]
FYRLGLNPMDLAPADPMCLDPSERLQWGRYYQEMPRVLFGDITDGFAALRHPNPPPNPHLNRPPTANPSIRKTPQ